MRRRESNCERGDARYADLKLKISFYRESAAAVVEWAAVDRGMSIVDLASRPGATMSLPHLPLSTALGALEAAMNDLESNTPLPIHWTLCRMRMGKSE